MGCIVPNCGGRKAPGKDVCAYHAEAEAGAVAYHEYERVLTLAEMYPGMADIAMRDHMRRADSRQHAQVALVEGAEWTGDGTRYGIAAFRGIMANLADDVAHGRNNALNRAAFRLGRIVGGGEFAHESAVARLRTAAGMMNLPRHEVDHILRGGYTRGVLNPKAAPERRAA